MNILERIDSAFKSDDKYISLRDEIVKLQEQGIGNQILLDSLEAYREMVSSEADEDIILDVMDFLVGW